MTTYPQDVQLGLYLAGALVLVLLGTFLLRLCRRLLHWWRRFDILELKDQYATKAEIIKTTAQIVGGAFFLFSLVVAWQNLVATQKNIQVSQEKNITDLFTKAVEQLGSDKIEVRLGGIYALERLAHDSPKDYWPILEILTAYVRERAPLRTAPVQQAPEMAVQPRAVTSRRSSDVIEVRLHLKCKQNDSETGGNDKLEPTPTTDIQAVLTVLRRRPFYYGVGEEKEKYRKLNLSTTDLRGAFLIEANLKQAHFYRANLQGALLNEANLELAVLTEADLQGAFLTKAHLKDAYLEMSNMQNTTLNQAVIINTQLQKADLRGAQLQQAVLREANLQGANLRGAHLVEADMHKTYLFKADLRGADLQGVKNLTREQLASAITDDTTQLPDYLKAPPSPPKPEAP